MYDTTVAVSERILAHKHDRLTVGIKKPRNAQTPEASAHILPTKAKDVNMTNLTCCTRDHQSLIKERVRVDENECWNWQITRARNGYGIMQHAKKNRLAHRISYMAFKGAIPEGLVLDHLCRNRGCVNPDHLEPVTQHENVIRGFVSRLGVDRGYELGVRPTLDADDSRHGTANGYRNYKCRCQPCRDAHAAYHKPRLIAYRARKKAGL